MEHILSLSYGKDSLACLGAIEQLGWPLDRIVHAEVWATDTIPADLPPMVEFKAKADKIIKERWGIEVEHVRSRHAFEERFYTLVGPKAKPAFAGRPRGWPGIICGNWCNRDLKQPALKAANKEKGIYYLGIATDEPKRFHNLSDTKNLRLWRLAGQRRIADAGAKITICFHPSTLLLLVADAGSVTINLLDNLDY